MLLKWGFYGGDDDAIVSEIKAEQMQITRFQLKTLRELEWLEDTVLDFYTTLLKQRECSVEYKGFRCHFFSTFFYPTLMGHHKNKYTFSSVKSWLDLCKYSLFNMDRLFFLAFIDDVHWALVVVHVSERKIEYLDSMPSHKGQKGQKIMENVARYLDDYAKDQHLASPNAEADFEKLYPESIPRQTDDDSCGVFTLAFADYRALGRELTFCPADIRAYRKKIAQEILIG